MLPHATIAVGNPVKPKKPMVIDLSAWLANAGGDAYVLSLARHGWHNCSVADHIVMYYCERSSSVADLLSLLHKERDKRFDCLVNADEVKQYISQKRSCLVPHLNAIEISQGRLPCPEPAQTCRFCGVPIGDIVKSILYQGYYYCAKCGRDSFAKCGRCEALVYKDDLSLVSGKERWCVVCRDNNATFCACCEQWFEADEGLVFVHDSDGYYCESCQTDKNIERCYRCDNYFADTITPSDDDDRHYCSRCAETVLHYCDNCENYIVALLEEYGDRLVCEMCLESLEEAAGEE